ncbi:MAG: AI-2E family transporter [Chloroflexi bacterium]|nr:AI-2E family transporter [Chloroflexota bacterium]
MNRYWSALAAILLLLYAVRSILAPFVVALGLAYILVPLVDLLSARLKWPRGLVVAGFYVLFLGALGWGIYAIEPTLARESRELTRDTPTLVETLLVQTLGGEEITVFGQTVQARVLAHQVLRAVEENLGGPAESLRLAEQVLHNILEFFLLLIVLFYLLKDWNKLGAAAFTLAPAARRAQIEAVAARIHIVLGRYVRGQLVLVALMSAVTWVFLHFVFDLRFALPIAIATGFLEVVPLLGPAIAASIAAIVAFSQGGPQFALWLVLFYTVARHVEDYLVVPTVVGRAVHLHPIVTIFAVLSGGAIAGVLGMILAVPVAAALSVIWDVWRQEA